MTSGATGAPLTKPSSQQKQQQGGRDLWCKSDSRPPLVPYLHLNGILPEIMFTPREVRAATETAVKPVSDEPGACLDKLAARTQKPSSSDGNEALSAEQKTLQSASEVKTPWKDFTRADLELWGAIFFFLSLRWRENKTNKQTNVDSKWRVARFRPPALNLIIYFAPHLLCFIKALKFSGEALALFCR